MNFAWANPVTGLREQTLKAPDGASVEYLNALRSQAEHRVWTELQTSGLTQWRYYQQAEVGSVGPDGDHVVDILDSAFNYVYAWCDPETGKRMRAVTWPSHLAEVLRLDRGFKSVIVYAEANEFRVFASSPEPEIVQYTAPVLTAADLAAWKTKVDNYVPVDQEVLTQATAWALLDIAASLRKIVSAADVEVSRGVQENGTDSRESPGAKTGESSEN